MTDKKVVVDIDGVLAEFTYAYSTLAHKVSGGLVPKAHSTGRQQTWDWDGQYSKQLMDECWKRIDESDSFWAELPLLCSASEVEELHRLKHEGDVSILYLTGRFDMPTNSVADQTRYWLEKYDFPQGELAFSTHKADFLRARGETPMSIIDDKPETIEELANSPFPIVCRDWTYNRHLDLGIPRVYSLGEWIHGVMSHAATWYSEKADEVGV